MALPLIAAIIAGVAVVHQSNKSHYQKIERKRINEEFERFGENKVKKLPSDTYSSDTFVKPLPGSVICCEVFNMLDHSGIWIDENCIVELSNSGLIKAVSTQRFLDERSGENIFVACDQSHKPIIIEGAEQRAISQLFKYREYDVIDNNCHRFVQYCLSGQDLEITTFSTLNKHLATLSQKNIYWDKVKLQSL